MDVLQTGGFVVNVLTMVVAIGSSAISYLVYKDSTSPDVIVYLEQNNDAKTILNIVIKNIGKSAAKDVKFSFDRLLPHRAFHGDARTDMKDSAFITGIPFLAPGSSRVFMFGDFKGIKNFIGDEKIKVTTTFSKANSRNPLSRKIVNESYIEILSMVNVDASDNSNCRKIADNLSKIEEALVKLK
ncbi:hypothetical protein GW590_03905 [Rahnella sp. SAP-1]|uniref:Uncharacterized protein n=1 Tax=Rouxiella aceris TaxID=2703884 RepID=A0A848MD38_9GAMM|nr:hypothetical protein [Rouxiella aceris]NMP26017.1 hypothetical protein [Rouxiella aceris]